MSVAKAWGCRTRIAVGAITVCIAIGAMSGAAPAQGPSPAHGSYYSLVASGGTLKILSDTRYKLIDYEGADPYAGTYSYRAAKHKVVWESGFAKRQGWKSTYSKTGRVIDVHTPSGGFNSYTWYQH